WHSRKHIINKQVHQCPAQSAYHIQIHQLLTAKVLGKQSAKPVKHQHVKEYVEYVGVIKSIRQGGPRPENTLLYVGGNCKLFVNKERHRAKTCVTQQPDKKKSHKHGDINNDNLRHSIIGPFPGIFKIIKN